ncbi:MAG: periplasmic heavy metal sensor [Loktanella sp.]|nr:periplasmic heavy metal sensor [Loktanella sp.]
MADPIETTARPSRLWRIVLVVSLALNLAVVGVVGGALVSGRFKDGPPSRIDFGLGPVARAMSPDDRREIGRALRQDRSLRSHDFSGQMAAMTAALRADPYQPAALEALLEDHATRLSQVQSRARLAVLDRIAAMSLDDRNSFADRLDAELQRERPARERRSGD